MDTIEYDLEIYRSFRIDVCYLRFSANLDRRFHFETNVLKHWLMFSYIICFCPKKHMLKKTDDSNKIVREI